MLELLEDRCAPAVLTVNSIADNTTADSSLTLREAIQVVNGTLGRSLTTAEQAQVTGKLGSSDTIQFNLPSGPQTISLTGGTLQITKPVAINGPGAANLTISGIGMNRDLLIGNIWSVSLSLTASISGLTITGGAQTYGAGVLNFGTLTISNCTVSNNVAGTSGGGGIYNVGALTLTGSTIASNSCGASTDGGGLYNLGGATATVTNCTFSNNVAGGSGSSGSQGGGAFNSGTITLTGSTFNANSAGSDSGGFFTDGTATITNCIFTNNKTGADGGAIHATGALVMTGCLIAGNTASSCDGGMEESSVNGNIPNSLKMTNCTFVNNTASGSGGGMINWLSGDTITNVTFTGNRLTSGSGDGSGIAAPGTLTLQNTIVAGNFQGTGTTPNDISGNIASGSSYNLIGTGGAGGLKNGTNHNQVGVASPGLGALASNGGPTQTIALLPGSPAIDAGSNSFVTSGETDQRGLPRIANGTVDIGAFEVQPASASTLTVTGLPASIVAGTVATITVTARNGSGTATGYTGTVHFTSSDSQAGLPADYTFVSGDNGVHTFNITLKTAGTQSVTATDTITASITGGQSGIAVTPASASTLAVTGLPNSITAGVASSITVTALDAFGNTATSYTGPVHFSSTDSQAVLPANSNLTSGVGTFSATLRSAGSQSITVADTANSAITGKTAAVTVTPAAAASLIVSGPTSVTAGVAFTFTVTAKDAFGNTATSYTGPASFTSSDARATLPANSNLTNGVGSFQATMRTAGTQKVTATDTLNAAITGSLSGITVNPAVASTFTVTGVASTTTAGATATVTVTAYDSLGNVATGYLGTVHFTSSDPHAILPADYTFVATDKGVHTFNVTLLTAGTQSLTATDSAAGVTGAQTGITVNPAVASTLSLIGFPSPIQAGVAGTFTVTAMDAYGNIATGYLGTVHFTSSDPQAALPADYTFASSDNGVHTFSATLNTPGSQTVTAVDTLNSAITGAHPAITVNAAPAGPILMVNSTVDSNSPDNFLTLREAIAIVDGTLGRSLTAGEQAQITGKLGSNDTIEFNLPSGAQTITLTGGALDITQPVTIAGPGAANLTINGNNADRVFIVGQIWSENLSLAVSISGLTIAGGNQSYGAGLLNFGTLTLASTTFANNAAGSSGGGGIYNVGTVTLNSCTFTGNSTSGSTNGGAIDNISSGTATVTNCTFTGNTASSGAQGGAIGSTGTMTISGSTFTGNSASSDGGAIYNDGAMSINTTTLANNSSASDGGAIRSGGAQLILSACTLSGNTCVSVGGAIDSSDTAFNAINCTLVNNTAGSGGGAIFADANNSVITNCTITANRATVTSSGAGGGLLAYGVVTLQNTIIAGNFRGSSPSTTADDIAGSVSAASAFNLIGIGGAGGLTNGTNNNQVGVANPGLGTLANNGGPTLTVALLAGSPAINAGSTSYVTAGETDERGLPRIARGTVDIGAFESQ